MDDDGRGDFQTLSNDVSSDHGASLDTDSSKQKVRYLKDHEQVYDESESPSDSFFSKKKCAVLRRGWKTSAGIVGFYLLAYYCAAAHYGLLYYLDERVIISENESFPFDSTTIPQTYATTASLVLVTAFRAAILASVSLSYTQSLWRIFRLRTLKVGLIEELFQIRSNPFRLFNHALLRHTPTLLAFAIFAWLVPIAMVYPPGTLVVNSTSPNVPARFNVSVLSPEFKIGPSGECPSSLAKIYNASENANSDKRGCSYGGPSEDMLQLALSVLINPKIAELDRPSANDASYSIRFIGPILRCNETGGTNFTTLKQGDFNEFKSNSTDNFRKLNNHFPTFDLTPDSTKLSLRSIKAQDVGYYPCDQRGSNSSRNSTVQDVNVFLPIWNLDCSVFATRYHVDISFVNGIQHINYSTFGLKPYPSPKENGNYKATPPLENTPFTSLGDYYQTVAIAEGFLSQFYFTGDTIQEIPLTSKRNADQTTITTDPKQTKYRLLNGSDVVADICNLEKNACRTQSNRFDPSFSGNPFLPLSVFNTLPHKYQVQCPYSNLHFTQDLLNEALANLTISALSLNYWHDVVNGTMSERFNMYLFTKKWNFFLPYGLLLLFAIPIMSVGIVSLHDNGISAIDGGFLQILVTTTGRTGLEKCAKRACLGGEEGIPKELKELKVRFGELLENGDGEGEREKEGDDENYDDGTRRSDELGYAELASGSATQRLTMGPVRRAGFGTLEETRPLMKGVRYG